MADITACDGNKNECPSREKCYRYTCLKNPHWQAYFLEKNLIDEDGRCVNYIKNYVEE